jgi:hypothetical protein
MTGELLDNRLTGEVLKNSLGMKLLGHRLAFLKKIEELKA